VDIYIYIYIYIYENPAFCQYCIFIPCMILRVGRDSVVGKTTQYDLDGPGIESH